MSNPTSDTNPEVLGPLVRLWGLSPDQLPGPDDTHRASELTIELLREAVPFIDHAASNASRLNNTTHRTWRSKGVKPSPPSSAPVLLLQRTIPKAALAQVSPLLAPRKLRPETWACRRSLHADAPRPGTASWAEITRFFRDEHSQAEAAFVPAVVGSRIIRRWDVPPSDSAVIDGRCWDRFSMELVEARHKVAPGGLLDDRVFAVLLVTASVRGCDEFVVVSVAVRDAAACEGAVLARQRGVTLGAYTSVERLCRRPDEDGGREIEWIMATASDAKGVLPMWAQTRAVPGQILKGVGLFIGWIAKERERREGDEL